MRRGFWHVLLATAALLLAGCGSDAPESQGSGPKLAYQDLEKELLRGDPAACRRMTSDYGNKLAASVQLFAADCPEVVRQIKKGLASDPDLRTTMIDQVRVEGARATLVAHSIYEGKDVRNRVSLILSADGMWKIDKDVQLDDVAPTAPLAAYREYSTALRRGDGTRACALSTERGRSQTAQAFLQRKGGRSCASAVPFLAESAKKLPRPDVVGGEEQLDQAGLYALQSDGDGGWSFRIVVMQREAGKWLFDHSRDAGRASSAARPSSPVT